MGPAPMIRMVEISVLLGIELTDWILGTKKGRACCASPKPRARVTLARGVVFRPDSAPAKPPKSRHQPAISTGFCRKRQACLAPAKQKQRECRRDARATDPAEVGRPQYRQHEAARRPSNGKAEIHRRGVERQRDRRGLRIDTDDAGDLRRIEGPA